MFVIMGQVDVNMLTFFASFSMKEMQVCESSGKLCFCCHFSYFLYSCFFAETSHFFFSFSPAIEKITIAIGRRIQESENTTEQMSDFFYG